MSYRCNSCTRGPCHVTEEQVDGNKTTLGLKHGPMGSLWTKNWCKVGYSMDTQWRPLYNDVQWIRVFEKEQAK